MFGAADLIFDKPFYFISTKYFLLNLNRNIKQY